MFSERSDTIRKIRELDIPRTDLAAIAGVPAPRIAEFLNGRPLAASKVQAIIAATADVDFIWRAMAPYKIDTSNPEIFRQAVRELRATVQKLGGQRPEVVPMPLSVESPEMAVKA